MKRTIACFVGILMLLNCLPPLCLADTSAAEQIVVDCFDDYLRAASELCMPIIRVMDLISDYCEEPSWEKLVRARAASAAAEDVIMDIQMPVDTVTGEVVTALEDTDVEYLIPGYMIEMFVEEDDNFIGLYPLVTYFISEGFAWDLYYSCFDEEQLAAYRKEITIIREEVENEIEYVVLTANYLYLSLDSLDGKALWEKMKTDHPVFAPYMDNWYDDFKELDALLTANMDVTEQMVEDIIDAASMESYLLEKELADPVWITLADAPTLVPMPLAESFDSATVRYYQSDDNNDLTEIGLYDETDMESVNEVIFWAVSSKAEVAEYSQLLQNCGAEIYKQEGSADDEGDWTVYYLWDAKLFAFTYDAETNYAILMADTDSFGFAIATYAVTHNAGLTE